jgi:hypothetical protein
MNHLTQDELIQFKFELADVPDALLMRDHLDDCQECRERLAKLETKLAALNELKDDARVSDALETRTIAGAMKAVRPKAAREGDFPMPVWLQGVAAVIVAGFVVFGAYVMIYSAGREAKEVARAGGKVEELAKKAKEVEYKLAAAAAPSGGKSDSRSAVEKDAAEQPPFAPASAIELNVLPRREHVQLTIYNGGPDACAGKPEADAEEGVELAAIHVGKYPDRPDEPFDGAHGREG